MCLKYFNNTMTEKEAVNLVEEYLQKDGPLTYGYELVPHAEQGDENWIVYFQPGPNGKFLVNYKTHEVTVQKNK